MALNLGYIISSGTDQGLENLGSLTRGGGGRKKNNNNSNNSLPFLGTEELKNIDRNTIQLMSKR